MPCTVLLVADSHLGFDYPARPRSGRRRRGHDFFRNYNAALEPALTGEADIVVHAGDVFDRPSILPSVAYQAYEPLRRIADRGVPVYVTAGNHERSRLPHAQLISHPNIHIFHSARTFLTRVRGTTIALAGFPYERRDVRSRFASLVEQTKHHTVSATVRLLVMHHCVEGATVGPGDYMFTTAADVVRTADIQPEFAAVLTGHIHRHQVLSSDMNGRRLRTPVLYPGSVERTSFAEMDEPKGFMILRIDASEGECAIDWEFRRLPARPMVRRELAAGELSAASILSAMQSIVADAPEDAVLSIRVTGELTDAQWRVLSISKLRAIAPASMNIELQPVNAAAAAAAAAYTRPRRERATADDPQLSLLFAN